MDLRAYEWLTLAAIIIGPLLSVAITLWVSARSQKREQDLQLLRMLLATRATPSDPGYNLAINLVPVSFNKKPKVMTAWKAYMDEVKKEVSREKRADHNKIITVKHAAMTFQIMSALGFELSEGEIQTEAYISEASAIREELYLGALQAAQDIAKYSKRSAELLEHSLGQSGLR